MTSVTGAMPGAGAIPDQHYPFGSVWAAYRLPFAGANEFVTSRDAGVAFEGEPAAGDPPAGGDPPKPADSPKAPAMGEPAEPDADGMTTEAGRRLLADFRARDKQQAKLIEELQAAHATDDEKHDASVKAAAAKERDDYWSDRIRQTEVRSALRASGLTNDKALGLAARAPEFASLKVDEEGAVAGLDKAVEAFKKEFPNLFDAPAKPPTPGPTRGAQNGAPSDRPKTLGEAITAGLSTART